MIASFTKYYKYEAVESASAFFRESINECS